MAAAFKGVTDGLGSEWEAGGFGCGEVVDVDLGRVVCHGNDGAVGMHAGAVGVYAAHGPCGGD